MDLRSSRMPISYNFTVHIRDKDIPSLPWSPNSYLTKIWLFWKISTSSSLASSINQITNKQLIAEKLQIVTADYNWRDGFYFIGFWKRKRESRFAEMSDALSDKNPNNSTLIILESTGKIGCIHNLMIQIIRWDSNAKCINKPTKQGWKYRYPKWLPLPF